MTLIGYTMMCEQAGPKQLVRDVAVAEQAGFDFAVISDHYFPWLDSQGHSPYAWSVLGAAAQATDRIPLMTYVTCPIRRYHPAVVAQKAATMQLLSDGRFTLGLGAGENLNEHIVGGQWPIVGVRHEMLDEAVEIIRASWDGRHGDLSGQALRRRVREGLGPAGLPAADRHRGVGPGELPSGGAARRRHDRGRAPRRARPDVRRRGRRRESRASARSRCRTTPTSSSRSKRAMDQFRWFTGSWRVNAELPRAGVVRRAVQDRPRGGRVRPDAMRSRRRAARRRDPRVRGCRVHPHRARASRRGHPRAVHHVGGHRTASRPASSTTGHGHVVAAWPTI